MQLRHFIDQANGGKLYALNADVMAREEDGVYSFTTAAGAPLNLPATLVPCAAPVLTAAQTALAAFAVLQIQARNDLCASDMTVLRCFENGVALPVEWRAYRVSLREIVNGTNSGAVSLPVRPSFPAGT